MKETYFSAVIALLVASSTSGKEWLLTAATALALKLHDHDRDDAGNNTIDFDVHYVICHPSHFSSSLL